MACTAEGAHNIKQAHQQHAKPSPLADAHTFTSSTRYLDRHDMLRASQLAGRQQQRLKGNSVLGIQQQHIRHNITTCKDCSAGSPSPFAAPHTRRARIVQAHHHTKHTLQQQLAHGRGSSTCSWSLPGEHPTRNSACMADDVKQLGQCRRPVSSAIAVLTGNLHARTSNNCQGNLPWI